MYDLLLTYLKGKKENYQSRFHLFSTFQKQKMPAYVYLTDKRGNLQYNKAFDLPFTDKEFIIVFTSISENNTLLSGEINNVKKMIIDLQKEVDKRETIPISNYVYVVGNNANDTYKMKQRYDFIMSKYKTMMEHVSEYFIDMYTTAVFMKEEEKKHLKQCDYIIKKIKNKECLTPNELGFLTTIIDEIENTELKDKLSNNLDAYLKEIEQNEKRLKQIEKQKQIVQVKPRIEATAIVVEDEDDYVEEVIEDNTNYINYYNAICSIDSFDGVKTFLDSIKHNKNIVKVLTKVFEMLDDDNIALKNFLSEYLSDLLNEDVDSKKTIVTKKEPIVLYYGFLSNKNHILNDLTKEDIPTSSYPDVLLALNRIKKDGAKNKTIGIVKERKIIKTKYKNIRIYFRRLSEDIYIILGIFRKTNNKGNEIIEKTISRNDRLRLFEKQIVNERNNEDLWSKYMDANTEMEKIIIDTLKGKIKQ